MSEKENIEYVLQTSAELVFRDPEAERKRTFFELASISALPAAIELTIRTVEGHEETDLDKAAKLAASAARALYAELQTTETT